MKSISGVIAAILIVFGHALFGSIVCSVVAVAIRTIFPISAEGENWLNLILLIVWLFWLIEGFRHAKRTLA